MSKEKTPYYSAPNIYDVEKIIDIHSEEADPSFDFEKVRKVTKSVIRSEDPFNSSDVRITKE